MAEQTQAAIPAAWVAAGIQGVTDLHKRKRGISWQSPSSEEVAAIIARVRPLIETAERERIAVQVGALAAVSGGPSEYAYRNAAREIRSGGRA